jgi:simple sugar transport system permease protein
VAIHLINDWLVVGPLADTHGGSHFSGSGTAPITAAAHLWSFFGDASRLNLGWPLAIGCAAMVFVFLRRSKAGLEIRALGSSIESARAVGIPVARRVLLAMGVAGALAGLGGACMILGGGTDFRYPENYRDSYGFDGIAVALLGAGNPFGICLSALFIGALRAGAVRLQDPEIGLHRVWPEIAQALMILAVASKPALERLWRWPLRRAQRREAP